MSSTQNLYVIVVVGLRDKEFIRLSTKTEVAGLPVNLKNGGHISGGSNSEREAKAIAQRADLVLWQPSGARHFPGGVIPSLPVVRVHGVSSAFNSLRRWLAGRPAKPNGAESGEHAGQKPKSALRA